MPSGYWVAPEIQSASEWKKCVLSAKHGDLEKIFSVASAYEDGLVNNHGRIVVRKNAKLAAFWYRRGAELGRADCQNGLANCLSSGKGLPRDERDAMKWYKKAFRAVGSAHVASNIAVLYRNEGNERLACRWFNLSSRLGDGDATVEMAKALMKGVGVKKNLKQGLALLRKAIRMKFITEASREEAMYQLGSAYVIGCGVRQSYSTARKWLRRANRDADHELAARLLKRIETK